MSSRASIWRAKAFPYPYHQTFSIPGRRSESRYFIRTISSRPRRPCERPLPLALTPPWRFANAEAGDRVVHHHRSCLDAPGRRLSARAIAGPHTGRQAVFGLVGEADGIFIAVERHYRQYRTEGFFPHDAHRGRNVGEYG